MQILYTYTFFDYLLFDSLYIMYYTIERKKKQFNGKILFILFGILENIMYTLLFAFVCPIQFQYMLE